VHLVDFEGFGYSSGKRCAGLSVEQMHSQVSSLLTEVRADLPLFLFAHSLGCTVVSTYLSLNKDIAARLAGVIYSAPLFGVPDFTGISYVKAQAIKLMAPLLEDFTLAIPRPIHKVCRDKQYMRSIITESKAPVYASMGLQASMIRGMERVQA